MPGSIAYERFVWFHEQIKAGRYPNARHLADNFEVSRRTAKRHIEFMKDRLGAPLIYVGERRGYGYDDASFELPLMPITPEEALSVLIARTLLSKTAGGVISDAMRRFGFKLLDQAARFGWAPERLLENSSRLVHISGMVRHLAKELMLQSPPSGVEPDWIERYVAGHRKEGDPRHRQFSYLPLPSIGHQHADQLVRRVMICAPPGDNSWLEHLAKRIAGHRLKPERRDAFGKNGPPTLVHIQSDNMVRSYTRATNKWASVTPVILPGHDDRKPAKTRRLIGSALAQSGIRQHCEFEWSPFSHFRKSLSAHKYDKDKQPTGYIRPDHLMTLTAVHLKLRFKNELNFPGPLSIGAGRHCGLGIFAGVAA